MWNVRGCLVLLLSACMVALPAHAQMFSQPYPQDSYYQSPYGPGAGQAPRRQPAHRNSAVGQQNRGGQPVPGLQYDGRDAEMILRDQMNRSLQQTPPAQPQPAVHGEVYDNYYGHRINDENQVRMVMGDARYIGSLVRKKNGKPFVVIDKRNVQFYLYDHHGQLLRIGPVAIGKGRTDVGAFETPVGIFPIRTKLPVDDWIRPDWYFIEEGEAIPQKWEDRRVPGFFRYKLVFDGTRYIHYAEATGGRLTHGCLGLDWEDAEAVFHTLEVGSYCIIIDHGFVGRLAKGEFPVKSPDKPKPPETITTTVRASTPEATLPDKSFRSMW